MISARQPAIGKDLKLPLNWRSKTVRHKFRLSHLRRRWLLRRSRSPHEIARRLKTSRIMVTLPWMILFLLRVRCDHDPVHGICREQSVRFWALRNQLDVLLMDPIHTISSNRFEMVKWKFHWNKPCNR